MPVKYVSMQRLKAFMLVVLFSLVLVTLTLFFIHPTTAASQPHTASHHDHHTFQEHQAPELAAEATYVFRAPLSGFYEVPQVNSPATGEAIFVLDSDMSTLHYRIKVNDIENITMAHIHRAPAGENGPVVHWLYDPDGLYTPGGPFDPANPVSGTVTLSAGDLADLLAGNYYVNVHTTSYPAGEIRGQMEAFTPARHHNALLTGDDEVPPVATNASGMARFTLVTTDTLEYEIEVADIVSITMAHIHRGWPGANGPIIHWLYDPSGVLAPGGDFDPDNPVSGTLTIDSEDLLDLLSGYYYVNVHTMAYPAGEIRGQLEAGAIMAFEAHLSGENEVPPVDTEATGHAVLTLDTDARTLHYRVMVSDIVSITMAHIHREQPGENGPIVHWLYDPSGVNAPGGAFSPGSPISGSLSLTVTDVTDLLDGNYYINVHTEDYPAGEIRGQIEAFEPSQWYMAVLSGDQEVPPVTTNASGVASFRLGADLDELYYFLGVADIANITMAHIHSGAAGQNGPIEIWLYDPAGVNAPGGDFGPGNPVTGMVNLTARQLLDLLTGYHYVNVHTTANPAGEIRGQIIVPDVRYLPIIFKN